MPKEYVKKALYNQTFTAPMVLELHVMTVSAVQPLVENATALARVMERPLYRMARMSKTATACAPGENLPAVFHKNKTPKKNEKRSVYCAACERPKCHVTVPILQRKSRD